ncbi:MAG TPA: PspC domain-containing protein [Allosphingosinicella sp.]|jgi:phage shock protein PspC (stress-responsive transcriptional regulator)
MAGSLSTMTRDDTLLGACYAVSEDFGFNPLWLRILFAFGSLSSPAIALTAYAALTAIVVLSRWMVPDPLCTAEPRPESRREEDPVDFQEELPLAA